MDQRVRLAPGDEFAGLHRVYQQLQLGQLKQPAADEPAGGFSLPALDVQAQLPQGVHVVIDALALRSHLMGLQRADQLLDGHGVVLVGLPEQSPFQQRQFELLLRASRHGTSPLSIPS